MEWKPDFDKLIYITKISVAILLIAYSSSFTLTRLNHPFIYGIHSSGVQAFQGTFNENAIQNGYKQIKFGRLTGYQKPEKCLKEFSYWHPSFSNIIQSIPALIFGNTEFVIRMSALIFYFINLFLIFQIGKLVFDLNIGLLMSITYSFFPVNRIYNTLPTEHGTIFYTFTLIIIFSLVNYHYKKKEKFIKLIYLTYFLSILTDWFSVMNAFPIITYFTFLGKEKRNRVILSIIFLTSLGLFINFSHIKYQTGDYNINQILIKQDKRNIDLNFLPNYPFHPFFLHSLKMAFGTFSLILVTLGLLASYRNQNGVIKIIVFSQFFNIIFLTQLYKEGLLRHFYLFNMFGLFFLFLISIILSKVKKYKIFFYIVIIFGIAISSNTVIDLLRVDNINQDFQPYPKLESYYQRSQSYNSSKKFFDEVNYSENSLIAIGTWGYYIPEYYFGREKLCVLRTNRLNSKIGFKEFDQVYFLVWMGNETRIQNFK